ncbi:threonine/serine exporter family protein [Bacillus sp. FJAT-29790]|uniref:threonine/serine exporter family protein n=1 Tax=Bacillus sp. FJAT-29790 TaxID=1895002 RepID=UPI001C211D6E|nr:threonine/serine exporter family protein [Bacillus sp. FJAT-29790]MBU8878031.1 threonine/serine exporter family protein [Bacillus sp. FJAT-29790]
MVLHLITSFIASAAFGVLFNAPKKSLIKCGFVGMVGWIIYFWLVNIQYDAVVASLFSAFSIGLVSQLFARIYKTPMIIFSVAGIIPLVPGGKAYDAMRHLVENDYKTAIELAAMACMISGAIAAGLVMSEVLNQVILKIIYKRPSEK